MCRKKRLQGCCCICFGLGMLAGYALEGWLLCCLTGLGLILFGTALSRQR